MKTFLTLLATGLFSAGASAQLKGVATMAGQSAHAGIKVKFIAGSSTAVTDSATTNAAGSYSISLTGGVYTVVFSRAAYQTVYYNNGNSLVLTNTVTLSPVNLSPGN